MGECCRSGGMKKLLFIGVFLPVFAFAQTFPVNNLQINGNVTGNVTGTGAVVLGTAPTVSNFSATGTLSLPSNSVTNAFLAQASAYTTKCNSGASTGNITDCVRPEINVEDYGVKGDNVTDNSAAMANAITACVNLGGCNIRIGTKSGTNFLMHGVTIASNGINVVCEDGAAIINNSTNNYALQFGNGITQYNTLGIVGCRFGQATGVTPVTGNVGLSFNDVLGGHLHDVTMIPFPAALNQGLAVINATFLNIDGLQVSGMLSNGVVLNGGSTGGGDLYLTDSYSDANGNDGWDITDYQGVYASNVTAYNNTRFAWNLFKTSFGNKNLFFNNVIGDTSGNANWQITSLNTGVFTNAWGSTQQSITVNTGAPGFLLAGSGVTDVQMVNTVAVNNNSHGIEIFNSGGMPQNITLTNTIAGSSSFGNGKAAGGGYGIWIDNFASPINVIGGEALNNTSGPVHLNGTSTTARISNLQGLNPQMGTVTQPAVPSSGTTITNTTGVDCMVYIVGGTVTGINVGGSGVLTTTPAEVLVPANKTITLTYSVAPTWQWSGL